MWCCNDVHAVMTYGTSAYYKAAPSAEQRATGVVPLDSLPAAWWNCMWCDTNSAINEARDAIGSFIDEVNTLLTNAGIQPNCNCVDTIYRAVNKIRQTIGDASVAGAVKSSSCPGEVSIDANCVGNASSLTTTARTVVGAVNELKCTYDCCISDINSTMGGKAPTSHASSATTYGVGNSTCYGHLKISDTYTTLVGCASDGIAASQKAVNDLYQLIPQGTTVEWGTMDSGRCAGIVRTIDGKIAINCVVSYCYCSSNKYCNYADIDGNIHISRCRTGYSCARHGGCGWAEDCQYGGYKTCTCFQGVPSLPLIEGFYSSNSLCHQGSYRAGLGLKIGRTECQTCSIGFTCTGTSGGSSTCTVVLQTCHFATTNDCCADPTSVKTYHPYDFSLVPFKITAAVMHCCCLVPYSGASVCMRICFRNNTPFNITVCDLYGVGCCSTSQGFVSLSIYRCTFGGLEVPPGATVDAGYICARGTCTTIFAATQGFVAFVEGIQTDITKCSIAVITTDPLTGFPVGNHCTGYSAVYTCSSPYGVAVIGYPGY